MGEDCGDWRPVDGQGLRKKNRQGDQSVCEQTGTGNQFAAAAAIVYEKAKTKGGGNEVPADWMMTSVKQWSDRGFFPLP
jgi:hypothetical protein